MKIVRYSSLFAGAALLAGCAGVDVDRMNATQISGGTEFTRQLAMEYRGLANFEAREMNDWRSADHFARKGLAAAGGQAIGPDRVEDWNIPAAYVADLADARARLVSVLDGGARETYPVEAALAQAKFDCWLEQQEENIQPDHIAACRDEFFAALALIEAPAFDADAVYFVFFDFDRFNITSAAAAILDQVVADYNLGVVDGISVVGHTDRAGPASYNQALSERRAASVRDALVARGVPANRITTAGLGETQPLVPTPDGVREPSNRRAEIRFF